MLNRPELSVIPERVPPGRSRAAAFLFKGTAVFCVPEGLAIGTLAQSSLQRCWRSKRGGMPDITSLAWWALVLGASLYLVWERVDDAQPYRWVPRTRRMGRRRAAKTIALDAWRGRREPALMFLFSGVSTAVAANSVELP